MTSKPNQGAATKTSMADRTPVTEHGETEPISEEEVRERAYCIWLEEGQPEGRHHDHWMRARWELEQRRDDRTAR
jgi:hypothetical protein